jgi:hypothetical protein
MSERPQLGKVAPIAAEADVRALPSWVTSDPVDLVESHLNDLPTRRVHDPPPQVPRAFSSPYGPVANVIWYGADADDRTKVTNRLLTPLPQAPAFPENRRSRSACTVKRWADTHSPGCVRVTVPDLSTGFPCV